VCRGKGFPARNLVKVEAGRGARVNPWHVGCDQDSEVGFRSPRPLLPQGCGNGRRPGGESGSRASESPSPGECMDARTARPDRE
jgi:hypothetical protein